MDVGQLERCKRGVLNAAEELAFELRGSELRERLLEMQVGIYRPMFGTSTHPLGVDRGARRSTGEESEAEGPGGRRGSERTGTT
jgi:hypothetical protein